VIHFTSPVGCTPGSAPCPTLGTFYLLTRVVRCRLSDCIRVQEKRDLIMQEFYTTEQHYVEALQLLVEVSNWLANVF